MFYISSGLAFSLYSNAMKHFGFLNLMYINVNLMYINELPRGKTNNVVSEQVRHKPTCTSTEKS